MFKHPRVVKCLAWAIRLVAGCMLQELPGYPGQWEFTSVLKSEQACDILVQLAPAQGSVPPSPKRSLANLTKWIRSWICAEAFPVEGFNLLPHAAREKWFAELSLEESS